MKEVTEVSIQQGRELSRQLHRGELTPAQISMLPAQQLYVGMLVAGLDIAPEVIPFTTGDQYRLILDFDFWERDRFIPERFCHWLHLIDSSDSFELFEQFLRVIPKDLLELSSQHYLEVQVFEEDSGTPAELGWFTPDMGRVWIRFKAKDEDELRLLGKFYAYLFQRSPELFYQLVLNVGVATTIELEENCLEERERRLLDAGLPDIDTQLELQSPLSPEVAARKIASRGLQPAPTLDTSDSLQRLGALEPLSSFFAELTGLPEDTRVEELIAELARILNTGLVVYRTALSERDEVELLQQQVRGLVNIGLEVCQRHFAVSAEELYQALSLQGLYRLGLHALLPLRAAIAEQVERRATEDGSLPHMHEIHDALLRPIPLCPLLDETVSERVYFQTKPFEHVSEIEAVIEFLQGAMT